MRNAQDAEEMTQWTEYGLRLKHCNESWDKVSFYEKTNGDLG